ncbi:MAG: alpha-galactosidase, partial [Clostridia bacterium]|nr:alpha-galactosidase [Clostridia bacterium]
MKAKTAVKLAGGAAIATAVMKKANICPKCLAKNLLANFRVSDVGEDAYNNGVALTPPMGWASWNKFRHHISENIIYDIAVAMKNSGLADAGYQFVNIDDCWQSSMRDDEGRMQSDFTNFPSGIPALCKKVNDLGLKLGIYSSNGSLTCEDLPASLGHERIDAETFARWGIEYFKYDFCHNTPISSLAPEIENIRIEIPGEVPERVYLAEQAQLTGNAKLYDGKKLASGKYVGGLCFGNGKMIFTDVIAEKEGEYALTIGIRKAVFAKKYAEVVVNEKDVYPIHAGATMAPSAEGRLQTRIYLREGKNSIMIHNPIASRMDSAAKQYTNMGKELKRATALVAAETGLPEKPITYSICEWGMNMPWKWGRTAGNLWRTTHDIQPTWFSICMIYEFNVRLWKYAAPGSWNDPDMLEVGNGNLTDDENRAHFSLWCMMAAPLILGNDLRTFLKEDGTADTENKTLKIVTNKAAIAINQDKRGLQCRRIKTGTVDILVKPLENKELAVCVFNKTNKPIEEEIDIEDIAELNWVDLPEALQYEVYDIWNDKTFTTKEDIETTVPGHGVSL